MGWWSSVGRCVYMDSSVTMLLTHRIMRSPPHRGGNGWGQCGGRLTYRWMLTYLWCHSNVCAEMCVLYLQQVKAVGNLLIKTPFMWICHFSVWLTHSFFSSAHTSLKCNNRVMKLWEDALFFCGVMSEAELIKVRKSYADSSHSSFRITSWITYIKRN